MVCPKRDGDNHNDYEKYLLTLGQPDQDIVGEDVLLVSSLFSKYFTWGTQHFRRFIESEVFDESWCDDGRQP